MKLVSMNTAGYTLAKKRLCEKKLKTIACKLGKTIDKDSKNWRYNNRDVFLGDGTVINLEDNDKIKKDYPVNLRNGKQNGLPKLRFLCFFSASSGAFIDGEIGSYCGKGQGETSLLKKMMSRLETRSILVLDRFFTRFELRKEIVDTGRDYVVRARDKAAIKYLKRKNDIEIIETPCRAKNNIDKMKVRYIKSSVKRKGFRVATLYIVTSLLKENGHKKNDIEMLYLKRWGVELDIRHLKETLEVTYLKSKTPQQARKELWVHLISFNLVKKLSNKNCKNNNQAPPKQCFKIYVEAFKGILTGAIKGMEAVLLKITENEVLKSKYRREPRAVIKYKKKYEVMNMSRIEAKKVYWGKSGRRQRQALLDLEAA